MNELLWNAYEFLTTMLPFGIACLTVNRRQKNRLPKSRLVALLVFALYIMAVFYVTGAGTLFDILRRGIEINPQQLNLIPFYYTPFGNAGHFLNAVMFVPFGFLLPLLWPRLNKIGYAVLYGFGFSMVIELSQLLNVRTTDVDDLLMNTLGALVGC
ncbi:VanZ family protein [Ruminococcaceae bacterium OttesenSCG-928-A16]|nr:VanZ family protein [Ruminococcaceae bacterium OttesenSCG-928-A16]